MAGHCEDCTGCCTVFEISEIQKPFGHQCKYIGQTMFGVGCQIYETRPQSCQNYVCLWLDSQRREDVESLPEALRPDACKVVLGWPFGKERDVLHVYPYPNHDDAWKSGEVGKYLREVVQRGGRLLIVLRDKRIAIKGDMAIVGTAEEFDQLQQG